MSIRSSDQRENQTKPTVNITNRKEISAEDSTKYSSLTCKLDLLLYLR